MTNDLITILCEIIIVFCMLGLGAASYVWYLDRLWFLAMRKAKENIQYPVWTVEDKFGKEIEVARFD